MRKIITGGKIEEAFEIKEDKEGKKQVVVSKKPDRKVKEKENEPDRVTVGN
jgi:hypothetical protein